MAQKSETKIQNNIILGVQDIAWITREQVGKFYTQYGEFISVGFLGKPDLMGFRLSDGKIIFLETKTPKGKASKEQKNFAKAMSKYPVIHGFVRTVEEAREVILNGDR